MKIRDYQDQARRTQNPKLTPRERLEHALWGLSAEVGEVCGLYQKTHQGHPLNAVALRKEIGDILWFVAELCDVKSGKVLKSGCKEYVIYNGDWYRSHKWDAPQEPVKRARWITYPECLGYDGAYNDEHIVCSTCHSVWNFIDNDAERFDYCPACGARMDGEVG